MKIFRFKIDRLHNEEWFRFHTEFEMLTKECGLEMLGISQVYSFYHSLYREVDRQMEVLRMSFHTRDTMMFDRQRVEVFCGLRNSAKSLRKALSEVDQLAAAKVYAVVANYNPSLRSGTLPSRTAAIDNLLQDLLPGSGGDACLWDEVQQLGLAKWVESLREANQNYKMAMDRRIREAAARPKAGRLKEIRYQMDRHYTRMIWAVDNRLLTIPGATREEEESTQKVLRFARQLNRCIARYHAILKGRQTRKENRLPAEMF